MLKRLYMRSKIYFSIFRVLCFPTCVCVCVCQLLSHVQLFVILWTVACQAPLSMEFSRQEYWSGQALPSSGDLLQQGIESGSPALQADSLSSELPIYLSQNCSNLLVTESFQVPTTILISNGTSFHGTNFGSL